MKLKKEKKRKCAAPYCRNDAAPGQLKCPKCTRRIFRERHPVNYAYFNLRTNAHRRHKEFTLTLQEFEDFCKRTNYIELKGKTSSSASIDRIDPTRGYSADNIQVLTLGENTYKNNVTDKCPF